MSVYLKYVLKNIEPLRIADDSSSQNGQTVSLRYIPGTTIRGMIVNAFTKDADFEDVKKSLLSNEIRYCNAYLTVGNQELIPSPKGFYEDKTMAEGKKKIQNVVIDGSFSEGFKRASLGKYCYLSEDTICYYNVETDSDMKIKINLEENEKQNIFRNEYIAANHVFTGYIAIENEALKERVKKVFSPNIVLGNARFAGLGKCEVLSCDFVDGIPYGDYLPTTDLQGECYMLLLSNTAMRSANGEICGIDEEQLGSRLGVEHLTTLYCSTSVVDVKGYNRIWRTKIPSVVMFEQGSVFHFRFDGTLTLEKMKEVSDAGIGIRTAEGFGRVIFLKDYEKIEYKMAGHEDVCMVPDFDVLVTAEDEEVLKIAARGYYRNLLNKAMVKYTVENKLNRGKISNSQLGTIESLATAYKYDTEEAKKAIKDYLNHAIEKTEKNNIHKEHSDFRSISELINTILFGMELDALLGIKTDKDTYMGIPKGTFWTKQDEDKCRLGLLTMMIRYDNKKEDE